MQVSPDQFKLIMGPFEPLLSSENINLKLDTVLKPVVCQPQFWDFLRTEKKVESYLMGQSEAVLNRGELFELLASLQAKKPQVAWQNVNSEAFKKQYEWSQDQFLKKKLQKTVPIILQKCQTSFKSENLIWIFKNLLSESHFGWAYGFWQTEIDTQNTLSDWKGYLGQSPELIADWSSKTKQLKTTAVAGTLKATEPNIDLIVNDVKIKEEHLFVVDDISNKLRKLISESQIKKTEMSVLKLKHLLHLKTDFICNDLERQKALQLIQSLHPTAALGLYPYNLEMMTLFSKLPLQDERSYFAAPFTLIDQDSILSVAAIRNFYFSRNEIKIFSGCGVTGQSLYESELLELELKRSSVKKMMGISE